MVWFKRECGMSRSRRIMAAAKDAHGLETFFIWEEILSLNTENGKDGHLTDMDLRPDLMAATMGFWLISLDVIEDSIRSFVVNGLLDRTDSGYEIVGWEDYKPNLTGAQRAKAARAKRNEGSVTPSREESDGVTDDRTRVTPRQSRKTEEKEKIDRADRAAQVKPDLGFDVCSGFDLQKTGRRKTNTVPLEAMLHELGYHPKSKRHRSEMAKKLADEFCTLDDLALIGKHSRQDKIKDSPAFLATGLDGDWRKRLAEAEKWGGAA